MGACHRHLRWRWLGSGIAAVYFEKTRYRRASTGGTGGAREEPCMEEKDNKYLFIQRSAPPSVTACCHAHQHTNQFKCLGPLEAHFHRNWCWDTLDFSLGTSN